MNIGKKIAGAESAFCSLEFFPPKKKEHLGVFYQTVEKLRVLNPLFVSVTYGAGGSSSRNTLEVTSRLASLGYTAMAHLTCVGAQPENLLDYLHHLYSNGVENILALRGDRPAEASGYRPGPFRYAADLVRFVKKRMPEMGIGVAAYPAPHPESVTFAEDRCHTVEKLASGADFAITQLFFDVREYISLVDTLKVMGVNCPVIPGIMPVQSLNSLRRILSMCGANIPGKLYLELEDANSRGGTEAVMETGLKFAIRQIGHLLDAGAPGIHMYTLNQSDMCMALARETGLIGHQSAPGIEC